MNAPRRPAPLRLALAALAAVAAPGCLGLGAEEPVVERRYTLDPPAPAPAPAVVDAPPGVLQVEPVGADPLLHREGLVWRRGAVETGVYARHRWARPPTTSVREILAHALRAAAAREVVATEPPAPDPDCRLVAYLHRLDEEDRADGWYGVVRLSVALRDREGAERFRRTYRRERQAEARNPAAVAAALQRATRALAGDVAADVGEVLGGKGSE